MVTSEKLCVLLIYHHNGEKRDILLQHGQHSSTQWTSWKQDEAVFGSLQYLPEMEKPKHVSVSVLAVAEDKETTACFPLRSSNSTAPSLSPGVSRQWPGFMICHFLKLNMFVLELSKGKMTGGWARNLFLGDALGDRSLQSLSPISSTLTSSNSFCLLWWDGEEPSEHKRALLLNLASWSTLPGREHCLGCWEGTAQSQGNKRCSERLSCLGATFFFFFFPGITKYLTAIQKLLWRALWMPLQPMIFLL